MCVGRFIYVDVNPSTRTIDVHEEDAAIAAVTAAAAATATAIDVGIGGIYSPSIMLISEQRNFSFVCQRVFYLLTIFSKEFPY